MGGPPSHNRLLGLQIINGPCVLEFASLSEAYCFSTNSNINKLVERSILPSPSKTKLSDKQPKQEKMKQYYPEGKQKTSGWWFVVGGMQASSNTVY